MAFAVARYTSQLPYGRLFACWRAIGLRESLPSGTLGSYRRQTVGAIKFEIDSPPIGSGGYSTRGYAYQ